jgi:hypothetical protein
MVREELPRNKGTATGWSSVEFAGAGGQISGHGFARRPAGIDSPLDWTEEGIHVRGGEQGSDPPLSKAVDDNEKGDWEILDEYIAEDFVAHNPLHPSVSLDREGMKQGAELFRVAAPGARHEITRQVAEGDLVVSHIVARGVHSGERLGSAGLQYDLA